MNARSRRTRTVRGLIMLVLLGLLAPVGPAAPAAEGGPSAEPGAWKQFRYGARHHGANPSESTLRRRQRR